MSDPGGQRHHLRLGASADGGRRPIPRREPTTRSGVSRLALTRAEAAEALGISVDSFERYVQPEIRLVRRNSIRLIPVGELERWVDENAARALDLDR